MMFLLSDLGNPPNKKVLMVLFILGIGSTISFSQQVKDTKFSVDRGFFDKTDTENIVSYTTLTRHLGLDDTGLLYTSSIVISNNYEMKM